MRQYILFIVAICFEAVGTTFLPKSVGFSRLIPTLITLSCYVCAIFIMAVISQTLSLPVMYGAWSGLGILIVTVVSHLVLKQPVNGLMIVGLSMIVVGVTILGIADRGVQ